MLTVQKDVYSSFLHFLTQEIVLATHGPHKAQPGELAKAADALQLLRGWNGQMDKDAAAPLIATLSYERFKLLVAERAAPGMGSRYKYQMAPAVIEALLRTRPSGWFNDWDETLLRAVAQGLEDGRRTQGRDPGHWIYGKYEPLLLANPVGSHLPLLAGLFDIGPVAMSGSPTTVKQYDGELGPSMRLDADLADWDRSLLEGTTGQSGQVLSRHYKDQWERYYNAESFPMQFRKVAAKDVLVLAP
jgi:penicillin amidase